jgi:hypothetical protein
MKTRHIRLHFTLPVLSLASFLLSSLAPASSAFATPPVIVRASVSSAGVEGNLQSQDSTLSANGRFVAFMSMASNLVPGDHNGTFDVFLHDFKTGATQRVSLDSTGSETIGSSEYPSISSDGRIVAFTSDGNFVPEDNNGLTDIYVRNLKTGVTQCVSVDSTGAVGNNGSYWVSLSANGRFVSFGSLAGNLVEGDNNNDFDVFVRDLKTGATQRVSVDSAGAEANGSSTVTAISADGRFVAFMSRASNLVTNDNNGNVDDIFLHDLKTGATQLVSVDSSGIQGNNGSYDPVLSANGRFVAFSSIADNLVIGDNNGVQDVFVRDLKTGVTQRVSLDSSGAEGNNFSYNHAISANGRYIAFTSTASNLVDGDNNDTYDVFVRDLITGMTQRVSVNSVGIEGNSASSGPTLSANGRFVGFNSDANNLVLGDHNGYADIFVRRRW